ncbi:choice-of-anchor Q domain-containing protein [Acidobacteriota bacterium]
MAIRQMMRWIAFAGLAVIIALGACNEGDDGNDGADSGQPSSAQICTGELGSTYYVRPQGGDRSQCNGLADADYPGSGSGLDCAFNHPFIALPPFGNPVLQGGDRLIIAPGAYRMGLGAPGTEGCEEEGAFDCMMPPIPSGLSANQPTCIVGAGWDKGCPDPPELYGVERTWSILDLTGSRHVNVACLDLTDHEGCVEFHTGGLECNRDNPPYGDWAAVGIQAVDSSDVIIQDVDIHGLADMGIWAGRLHNWTLDNVLIAGNGWAGWDGDVYGEDGNTGTTLFRGVTVEWNGCVETWPGGEITGCWAQTAGGYGDGLGTGDTGGDWVFEDCFFLNNTSDGLDLLYHRRGGNIVIDRVVAAGNAGNQIKTAGSAVVINSLIIGNCGFFDNQPFTYDVDNCRAGGGALSFDYGQANTIDLVNSTIYSEGDVLIGCESCNGPVTLLSRNNIFVGDDDFLEPGDRSAILWTDCANFTFDEDYGIFWGAKEGDYPCPIGPHDRCSDPLLTDIFANHPYGLQPRNGSPAIDSGLPVGELGLIPEVDILGRPRPSGSGVDRGAYEVQ